MMRRLSIRGIAEAGHFNPLRARAAFYPGPHRGHGGRPRQFTVKVPVPVGSVNSTVAKGIAVFMGIVSPMDSGVPMLE